MQCDLHFEDGTAQSGQPVCLFCETTDGQPCLILQMNLTAFGLGEELAPAGLESQSLAALVMCRRAGFDRWLLNRWKPCESVRAG